MSCVSKMLSLSRLASEYLQSKDSDLTIAVAAIEGMTATFESLPSKDKLNKLIS